MPAEKTNADALRLYLSGAETDGAEQPIHALSLGGFRSSIEASGLGISINNPIPGVQVDLVAAENGAGSGALVAVSVDSLAWTPPGSTQGAAVEIANGETKVITGAAASDYVRVTRTSADDLRGTATIGLARCLGTLVAHREAPVTGLTTNLAGVLKNDSGLEITNLQIWIDPDTDARLFIGYEAADGDDRISDTSPLGDISAPNGVTITNQGQSAGAGLQVGTVAAGASIGLWLRRAVEIGADADAEVLQTVRWSYTYSGVAYTGATMGFYRVADPTLIGYLLYRGIDGSPDLDGAPYATFASLGYVTAVQAPGATYHYVLRLRNAYGLISQNTAEQIIEIDALGEGVQTPPSAPTEVTLDPVALGSVLVSAYYEPRGDGEDAADTWLIYLTDDGVDPDPDLDTPVEEAMTLNGGLESLAYTGGPYADGATIKALVRTRRTGPPISDSVNVAIVSTTAAVDNAGGAADPACCWAVDRDTESVTRVWTDVANRAWIDLIVETGVFRFVIDGVAVGGLTAGRFFGYRDPGVLLELPYSANIPAAANVEYDPGHESIAFAVGGIRVAEIDSAGDARVGAVAIEVAYPFAGARTAYIQEVGDNLDFSADLATVIMRLTLEPAVGGVNDSTMHILDTTGV